MQTVADRPEAPTAIRTDLGAIFVSLELSRSTWLITSLSPGGGEKMSKQVVRGGDVAGLLERFARLREKARARTGKVFPFVVIQEAGLDGFWIDRVLQNEGIESHVVDPASIATSRRRRRAKTDGTAFAQHALLRTMRAMTTWFCDAYASWQKGGVENANGRLRRWLPRQIDIDKVSDEEIQDIVITANLTPRKCLGFKTPLQAILKELGKDVQISFA